MVLSNILASRIHNRSFYALENQRIFIKCNQDDNFESKENHRLVQEKQSNKHRLNQVKYE